MVSTREAAPITPERSSGSAAGPQPLDRGTVWLRVLGHAAWMSALAALVVGRVTRFGFVPTDQGFILGLSWRILHGEIPHADIISPRPLGSALLHTIDFLVPAPLFVGSEFIAMIQLLVVSMAAIAVLTGTSPLRWGPLRIAAVATSALINLHLFPLMAWHTIDGLMFTFVGWWLIDLGLRTDSKWRKWIGLFLLGCAVMVKQSFMFAPFAGLLLLLFHPSVRHGLRANLRSGKWWRQTVVDTVWLFAFPIIYVGVVTLAGALGPAIKQLTGGTGAWGEHLYAMWQEPLGLMAGVGDWRRQILMVAGCAVLVIAAWLARRRLGPAAVWVRLVPVTAAGVITVVALADTRLIYPPTWAIKIAWIFIAVIALDAVVNKRFPWRALLIVLAGYMASLSWGYAYPALLAGTLVLATLEILVASVPELTEEIRRRRSALTRTVGALVGVAGLVVAGYALVTFHDRAPGVDRPIAEQTARLGDITPEMAGIRSNQSVATYLTQIRDCVEQYPAAKVAVLPDNAFVYPVLNLRNPFPMDWPLALELVADSEARMMATVDELNRTGNYLVLFQTVTTHALHKAEPVPASIPADARIAAHTGLENRIHAGLTGQKITCGSFQGVHAR